MTPAELVMKARSQGVRLVADGPILRCKCSRGLPIQLRDELLTHKPTLLAYLDGLADGALSHIRSPADLTSEWRIEWEERAAIIEYDGNLLRELAEHLAFQDILKQIRTEQETNRTPKV